VIRADRRGRAKSREMETPDERRKRLVKNRLQRECYGVAHRRLRQQWARRIERGETPICPRCLEPIGADQDWDLGHHDVYPDIEQPERRWCNRGAPNRCITSREW
jgi:hypothetical protein